MTEPVDLDAVAELQAALAVNAELREALEDDSRLNLQDAARLRAELAKLQSFHDAYVAAAHPVLLERDSLRAEVTDLRQQLGSANSELARLDRELTKAYLAV